MRYRSGQSLLQGSHANLKTGKTWKMKTPWISKFSIRVWKKPGNFHIQFIAVFYWLLLLISLEIKRILSWNLIGLSWFLNGTCICLSQSNIALQILRLLMSIGKTKEIIIYKCMHCIWKYIFIKRSISFSEVTKETTLKVRFF